MRRLSEQASTSIQNVKQHANFANLFELDFSTWLSLALDGGFTSYAQHTSSREIRQIQAKFEEGINEVDFIARRWARNLSRNTFNRLDEITYAFAVSFRLIVAGGGALASTLFIYTLRRLGHF